MIAITTSSSTSVKARETRETLLDAPARRRDRVMVSSVGARPEKRRNANADN
jgi:hypothetical protein